VSEEVVKHYFEVVERSLKEDGLWEETVRKFPPKSIEEAVRRIVERCLETHWDTENVDWKSVFQKLKDFKTLDDFINDLVSKREIPPSPEEEMRLYALAEEERILRETKKRVIEEEDYEKLKSAQEQISRISKRVKNIEDELRKVPEALQKLASEYAEEIKALKAEIERLKAVPAPPTPPAPPAAAKELSEEEKSRLEKMFKMILVEELGRVPRDAVTEFREELEAAKFLPYNEAAKVVEMLAREIVEREKRAPRVPTPKVLPPIPEVCPIDGSPVREVTRVPVGPVPVRLTAEEEYFRTQLGLPIPEREMVWVDVPVTMKVYACAEDHMFERDAAGRLVQRTHEYIYRKVIRETAGLRRITYAPPAPMVPTLARVELIEPKSLQEMFRDWLKRFKDLSVEQYMALNEIEKKRILSEWSDYVKRTGAV
jgi:hypothetical protein